MNTATTRKRTSASALLDLKIVGIKNTPDNGLAAANTKYFVRINRHLYSNQVAGT